jgi:hypothetical protein
MDSPIRSLKRIASLPIIGSDKPTQTICSKNNFMHPAIVRHSDFLSLSVTAQPRGDPENHRNNTPGR